MPHKIAIFYNLLLFKTLGKLMKAIDEKQSAYTNRFKDLSMSIERKIALRRNFMKEIEKRLSNK